MIFLDNRLCLSVSLVLYMVRLVFSIVFLIILAVFIAFNAQFSTDVNLFGYKLEAVPTVAVVLLTLVTGVLYSFGLYLIAYFSKRRSQKEKNKKRKNEEKEKALKTQEKEIRNAKATLEHAAEAPETLQPQPDIGTTPAFAAVEVEKKKVRLPAWPRRKKKS